MEVGYKLDDHLCAGPINDAAIASYRRDHTGPLHNGMLEFVACPRADDNLTQVPVFLAAKEANGGLDLFVSGGQPLVEIDFVVSLLVFSRPLLIFYYPQF